MISKLVERGELAALVARLKAQGNTIVTTNGSFDLLHIGHVTMLQEAKALGETLIVGVNSDRSIRRYKGKSRPICPEAHRAGMLAALECVDYVTIFDELTPVELLKILQPHIHVNSPEHGNDCVEREVVEQHGGRIQLSTLVDGMSTTELLRRVSSSLAFSGCRGLFFRVGDIWESAIGDIAETSLNALQACTQKDFRLFLSGTTEETAFLQTIFAPHIKQSAMKSLSQLALSASALEQTVDDDNVILAKSVILSRDMADIRLGRDMNCKTILISNAPAPALPPTAGGSPHVIARTFAEAVASLMS
ncbi:heptose adenosyltransferase [Candidatus Moduliflexus flocculans]|uniref:Heptose adenosyltransferase n=1 Tax=Candidatus Moduliflexus flocculans TaxID=1499966 RepID=A0A081BR70_9BACT|nr:heptose adenosyltransferase [Candidatus Moduliflexus flocculans]